MKKFRLNPPQLVVLSFFAAIMIGAALLSLPSATKAGIRPAFIDSLFTATSATCVTGLVVKDTATFFSPLGKLIILILIQCGGLGIMTLSTLFAIFLGKKLTISDNANIQSALDHYKAEGLATLILYIVAFTLTVELIGALIISFRWMHTFGYNWLLAAKKGIFHSVSAFCNAGFALFSDNLRGFHSDAVTLLTTAALIVIGGMGFVVFLEIPKLKLWRRERPLILSRLSLQTKIVVLATVFLIILGTVCVFFFEGDNTLRGMPLKEKIWNSLFTSITPRTAGFDVLPTENLRPATLFLVIILMFIGASPGGTGGGIKTVTFVILMASFFSMLYNKDRIDIFGRTVQKQTYRKAAGVLILSIGLVLLSTFLLSITEYATLRANDYFLGLLFESTSAFGTVGLSMGVSPQLSVIGKIIIICTMFAGRVGPLTLALAIAMRKEKLEYRYPEEKLMIG